MRTTILSLGLAIILGVSATACSAGEEGADNESAPEIVAPRREAPSEEPAAEKQPEAITAKACVPKTCAELGETCGTPEDGCGGNAGCGSCEGTCTPKTCAELGKSCGEHDDSCGKKVSCGVCATACVADPGAANNTPAKATMLGEFSDAPATKRTVADLKLTDGDEDWYAMAIKDAGFSTNPRISASVGLPVEVAIFFVCKSTTNYSTCPNTKDVPDALLGKGCKGKSSAMLQTDCSGIDEAGTAYVRVRKLASDGLCAGYSLHVSVD